MKQYKSFLLWLTAIATTGGILSVGLWPFTFFRPNSAVYDNQTGYLTIDKYSTVFAHVNNKRSNGRYMAIRCEFTGPKVSYSSLSRMLSLYNPSTGKEVLIIGNWQGNLVVRVLKMDSKTKLPFMAERDIDSLFRVSKACRFDLYIDSEIVLAMEGTTIRFTQALIAGNEEMIVGNSPWGDSQWNGNARIVPIDNSDRSSISWTFPKTTRPAIRRFLVPPWEDFSMSEWYARDIVVNISGFIPLGIVFALLFLHYRKKAVLFTIAMVTLYGGLLSLTIELLQAFIPYRNSQISDLVCNTAGACIGAVIIVLSRKRRFDTKQV